MPLPLAKTEVQRLDNRIDRKDVSFASAEKHKMEEREYWSKVSVAEKFQAITYLRECFYGPEATTGRLQRVYTFFKRQ